MATVRIRLRTQNGDLGPLQQTASETVGDVKRRLVADWSKLIAGTFCGLFKLHSYQPSMPIDGWSLHPSVNDSGNFMTCLWNRNPQSLH